MAKVISTNPPPVEKIYTVELSQTELDFIHALVGKARYQPDNALFNNSVVKEIYGGLDGYESRKPRFIVVPHEIRWSVA